MADEDTETILCLIGGLMLDKVDSDAMVVDSDAMVVDSDAMVVD